MCLLLHTLLLLQNPVCFYSTQQTFLLVATANRKCTFNRKMFLFVNVQLSEQFYTIFPTYIHKASIQAMSKSTVNIQKQLSINNKRPLDLSLKARTMKIQQTKTRKTKVIICKQHLQNVSIIMAEWKEEMDIINNKPAIGMVLMLELL